MQVHSLRAAWIPARATSPPPPPPPDGPPEDDQAEQISHGAGTVFSGLAKLPEALAVAEEFLGTALVEAALPLVGITAACGGALGMAGLAVAGALEIREASRRGDPAHALSGSGDVCRGMVVGSTTGSRLLSRPALRSAGRRLGYLQGGLFLAAGLAKAYESTLPAYAAERIPKRVEGLMEAGMGACAIAAAAGIKPGLSLAVAGVLGVSKFGYRHRQGLRDWAQRMDEHSKASWHKLKDVFHEPPTPPPTF